MLTISEANLKRRDIFALKCLYELRCLSPKQLYDIAYTPLGDYIHQYNTTIATNILDEKKLTPTLSFNLFKKKLAELSQLNVIEEVQYSLEDTCLFLTTKGINLIRKYYHFDENIMDDNKKIIKRGYFTASELRLKQKSISHQIHVNHFYMDFCALQIKTNWKYYDSKHLFMSEHSLTGVIPDGVITIQDKTIFIETDMATENEAQLFEKWESYEDFLKSDSFRYRDRDIVVLFSIENTRRIAQRINLVKCTAYEHLGRLIEPSFNIYIDERSKLIDMIDEKITPAKKIYGKRFEIQTLLEDKYGFLSAQGNKVKNFFNNVEYMFFVRDPLGSLGDMVIEEYFGAPLEVLTKITYLNYNNAFLAKMYKKYIRLIIVCPDEKTMYNDLKLINAINVDSVYYTTLDRMMEANEFHQALFRFSREGEIQVFCDERLSTTISED